MLKQRATGVFNTESVISMMFVYALNLQLNYGVNLLRLYWNKAI